MARTKKPKTSEEHELIGDAISKLIKRNIAEVEFWIAYLGLAVRDPNISAEEFQTIHRVASELDAVLDEYERMGYPRPAPKAHADFSHLTEKWWKWKS